MIITKVFLSELEEIFSFGVKLKTLMSFPSHVLIRNFLIRSSSPSPPLSVCLCVNVNSLTNFFFCFFILFVVRLKDADGFYFIINILFKTESHNLLFVFCSREYISGIGLIFLVFS